MPHSQAERPNVVVVDPEHPDPRLIANAAELIREGGLVAFPTETVYGLGANALDPVAVRRIFEAKGRPSFNPLIAHVADVAGAQELVTEWPPLAQRLSERFWPGPLTFVLPRRSHVPGEMTAGLDTVAVRSPSHPVAHALILAAGVPLAAPSANRFTELSPVTAGHVARSLGERIDMILDGGQTTVGIESTVLDLSGVRPVLLRPGSISRTDLESITGPLDGPSAPVSESAPRAAPGMIARHYAPRATVRLLQGSALLAALDEVRARTGGGARIGVITRTAPPPSGCALGARLPEDIAGYTAGLYEALHRCDDADCTEVIVEAPPTHAEWDAVRDRLSRAAHAV